MQTILPADIYMVVNKTVITSTDRKIITMLYQPIIGHVATSLYFTLCDDLDKREVMSEELTHYHLMMTMQLKLESIVIAREKLEAIGLLKTFFKKENVNTYVYQLYSPLSAAEFLNHPILNVVLYNNLGKKEYQKVVDNVKEISEFYSKEHVYKMWKEFYTEIAKKKKKEKKELIWELPEPSGDPTIDGYLLSCDTLYHKISTYRDSLSHYKYQEASFSVGGKNYLFKCMIASEYNQFLS